MDATIAALIASTDAALADAHAERADFATRMLSGNVTSGSGERGYFGRMINRWSRALGFRRAR